MFMVINITKLYRYIGNKSDLKNVCATDFRYCSHQPL